MVTDGADEFAAGLENTMKSPGELDGPSSSKRRFKKRFRTLRSEMMTDKAEESTVGPEKQMKCHRELMTSLCKSRLTRGLLSVMPEEEGAFQARGSAVSLEDARLTMRTQKSDPATSIPKPATNSPEHSEENRSSRRWSTRSAGPGDDPKVARKSVLFGMMPDTLSFNPEATNSDVKHQIMKEIRQFGRILKYEKIFKLLEGIQGPPKVRRQFVEFAIKEAARFKRRDLIKHLEKILDKTESDKFLSKDKHSPNL
ncbi:integrator complex subunit 6-like [Prionailurus iriomotensis]